MGWELDLSARPFALRFARTAAPGARRRVVLFSSPDPLYRMAARRVIATLVEENRRLRHHPSRRAAFLSTALAEALSRWARRRYANDGGGPLGIN